MGSNLTDIFNNEIYPEIVYFIGDLNWTFIILYLVVLYGMKHTEHYDWYGELFKKRPRLTKFRTWLSGLLISIGFIIFRSIGPNTMDSEYIAQLLRSIIMGITFSGLLVDWPIRLIEGRISEKK